MSAADVDRLDNATPTALTADHLHVILDCIQWTRGEGIPEHHAQSYDDADADDPKGTPAGWEALAAEAERVVGEWLGTAPRADQLDNAAAVRAARCVCGAPLHRPTWGCVRPRPAEAGA